MKSLLAILALASLAVQTQAQTDQRPTARPKKWAAAGGIHAGLPDLVSFAIGVQRPVWDGKDGRFGTNFIVVEPGLGATRISSGFMFAGNNAAGFIVRVSLMREYYNASVNAAGIEINFMKFAFCGVRVGMFRPLSGKSKMTLGVIDLSCMY